MADMDGFREANNFGFGQTSQFDNFHVKGASNYSWGMKDRLSRIFNPKTGRAVMLAFDHGFIMGPTSGLERIDLNIVPLGNVGNKRKQVVSNNCPRQSHD